MSQVITRTVENGEADLRLDRWFRRHYPWLGHAKLEKLLRTGQVRVDGGRASQPKDQRNAVVDLFAV